MGVLSKEYKDKLLSLKISDITDTLLVDLFSDRVEKKDGKVKIIASKINTNDIFVLEANEYFNKTKITTNAGLFIINKLLIEEDFIDVLGYINEPITNKVQSNMESKLATALMNDIITTEQFAKYLNRLQWFSKQFNSMISTSFSPNTIKPVKSAIKIRDKMIKENKELLKSGDMVTGVKIENAVKEEAKKQLKGDHGMNLYDSGARGSFDNNYKNMMLVKGLIADPSSGKFDFVGSNLIEGIKKEELPAYGTAIVNGAYPKSIGTAVSGDMSKQLTAAFQGIVADKPGTDCGTKQTVKVFISVNNANDFIGRHIMVNGKPILLTVDNIGKYFNSTVNLRSPMYCQSEKICSVCGDKRFEQLGITNIGLTASRMSGTLLNAGMKSFHDSTVKLTKIDINKITL